MKCSAANYCFFQIGTVLCSLDQLPDKARAELSVDKMSIFCREKVQVTFPTYSCGENLGQFSFDNFSTNWVASEIEWSKFQQKLVISPMQQKINKLGCCKKCAAIFWKFVDKIFVYEMSKFPLFVWLNYFGNLLKPVFVGKILKLIEENYCQLMTSISYFPVAEIISKGLKVSLAIRTDRML